MRSRGRETVAERKANGKQTVLEGDGFEVRAVMPFWGGSVSRARSCPRTRTSSTSLDPAPGTRAATVAAWGRKHPKLYASRHVLTGATQVALAIIGLTFLLELLPAIPWPDIDLPSLPVPSIDLPDIPWPSIDLPEVPGWVRAVLDSKRYWLPIVIGLVLAMREVDRRKKRPPPGGRQIVSTPCWRSIRPTAPPTPTRTSSRAPRPSSCWATAPAVASAPDLVAATGTANERASPST